MFEVDLLLHEVEHIQSVLQVELAQIIEAYVALLGVLVVTIQAVLLHEHIQGTRQAFGSTGRHKEPKTESDAKSEPFNSPRPG